jgi:hypothetical protein
LQVVKVGLHLVEDAPRPRALRRQDTAAMLQATMRPAGHGAQDVEIGDQRLR